MDSRILSAEHAEQSGVDQQWGEGNEAWWDWYLSLAADDGAPVELVELDPPAEPTLPTLAELREELATPYALDDEQAEAFRTQGYLKVPAVLTPGALALARAEVARLSAAGDGPGASGFESLDMMWQSDSDVLQAFALSPRLGRLAADLLGVADTRIYHDNVLTKTSGCGRTPWHFDAHHFPIASRDIVTSWIPLQAIPSPMGPLAFAAGKDTWTLAEDVDFNAHDSSYDAGVAAAFKAAGVRVDDTPFALGEISFHHAWCFHYARGNATTQPRQVMATTYFADGARLVERPTMVSGDFEKFLPGARPGEVIQTAAEPDRVALMAPDVRPAPVAGGLEGLAYWRERARALGARAVLNLDHEAAVDDVTAMHRAQLLPELAALLPLAPGRPVRTVLDLGCGIGRLTGDLAALAGRAIGVDPLPELLAHAPRNAAVEYRLLRDPGHRLPLADGEADVAFTCLVLGAVEGAGALGAMGDEIERVLAPCGIVLLAESVSDQHPYDHWTFRSVGDYAAAMPWAGLQEVAGFDDAGDPVSVMAGRKPAR